MSSNESRQVDFAAMFSYDCSGCGFCCHSGSGSLIFGAEAHDRLVARDLQVLPSKPLGDRWVQAKPDVCLYLGASGCCLPIDCRPDSCRAFPICYHESHDGVRCRVQTPCPGVEPSDLYLGILGTGRAGQLESRLGQASIDRLEVVRLLITEPDILRSSGVLHSRAARDVVDSIRSEDMRIGHVSTAAQQTEEKDVRLLTAVLIQHSFRHFWQSGTEAHKEVVLTLLAVSHCWKATHQFSYMRRYKTIVASLHFMRRFAGAAATKP